MSSGEPMDVTISMRVHGVEMKLGKLASGPTGQLVIETREGATVPAQHHTARIKIIKDATGIDIKTAPHIDQLRGILWEVTSSKEYGHVYGHFLKTGTMEEAITVLVTEFEKSRIQDRDIRRRTALGNHYMEEFKLWTQPSKHFFLSHSSV
jgi:hypothetical protein